VPERLYFRRQAALDLHWRYTGHGVTCEESAEAKERLSRVLPKLS
jgi:hypothetical protein